MKKIITLLAFVAFVATAQAQIETPQPSPSSSMKQTVGLTEISVEYSRPSMKGREIFGELVPYDQVWRTGANGSTDITFSSDVTFGGVDVPAGTYALYSKPGKTDWTVMLYKDASIWGAPGTIDEELVVAATTVTPFKMDKDTTVETFTIGFDNLTNNSAELYMMWENLYVPVKIGVDTKAAVQKNIDSVMAGPSANDYFSAGRFYFEEGMDMEKAHMWVSKATEMRGDAYWMWKLQAEIEAEMGNYKQAIMTATKAKDLAEKAGNMQYVAFNEANLAKWMKKK